MKRFAILALAICIQSGHAASLEEQLADLQTPANQAPGSVGYEKFYAVQTRYSPLKNRFEFALGGAHNFNAPGWVSSSQGDLSIRFFINDRWFVSTTGSYAANYLSDSGKRLLEQRAMLPDVAFAQYRGDLMAGFHTFYGKLRLTLDTVLYFDHYVSIGPGVVALNTDTPWAVVGDTGFVFWFGKNFSWRFGIKDFFYKEIRMISTSYVHDIMGHMQIGYVL